MPKGHMVRPHKRELLRRQRRRKKNFSKMEVIVDPPAKRRKTTKAPYVPTRTYSTPAIPYEVSQPNRFWRIKKGLDAASYWRKRYYRRRITGRGSYSTGIGRTLGSQIGGFIGDKAENLALSYITGLGSYNINKNVFLSGNLPVIKNPTGPNSSGGTTIRYTEYLKDIVTAGVAGQFSSETFLINIGNSKTFPWLSQIAENYEQFEIEGMVFEFKSTSSDALNSTNTALGTVMLATQYDVLDTPFASKQEMLNYQYASCVKPSSNVMHMIECDPRQTSVNELYVLAGNSSEVSNLPSNADARLYYLGRTTVATTGFQGTNVNIGQLHVTYQVRLLKPKLFATLGYSNGAFIHNRIGSGVLWNNSNAFGLIPGNDVVGSFDNIGVTWYDGNSLLINNTTARSYRLDVFWNGNTSAGGIAVTTAGTQLEILHQEIAPDNILSSYAHYSAIFRTTGNSRAAEFSINTADLPPSTLGQNSIYISIIEINPDAAKVYE